ncbi:thioredoxin-dependent thiol peroxidase [Rheinheimera sp. D18]|uniref:thioredoxin-dependent thiol peroxidase n=1 Tax=Rheinheimera sp. D18 TaxID=2545632 RepID=UPI001049D248|nr:thioredoxin-dependent thiol peroxidase [Rheinheimera sp. D18]QBL09216.1 thioredoxin-dependent thiol peroxidase [Rheinheimera sp. D18]
MQYLTAGAIAPDFTLVDQHNNQVQLSTLLQKNRVLVYFYPKAMTPGCTVQACGLRDSMAQLAAKGVSVLGISIDAPARLAKFAQRDQLNFTLLSDEDHKVADAFGVWGEKKFMGKVYDGLHRISFLIAQDGKVEKVFDQFKTKDHHAVVLDYLA